MTRSRRLRILSLDITGKANAMKHYKLDKSQIRDLAVGYGLAMVTDMITVEGYPVGYMYRDEPEDEHDSGWRFFAGNESDAYIDNPKNFSLLDVNVIANYDETIIPLLASPAGAAFDKGDEGDTFYDVSE
ncbi:DUF2185 domain-containing protein [Chitinimonas viridis]|uniref:DUF2185 domain-containing protein n=2 Tax=Chitinimonas TaxID=240411 RepID=A0ABT8B087_9NEIS|nr:MULTISPECIES: DUF2185 domain-containing protein [Chitinimonas]MDN3575464.1 DUF2185 domain-containing protein [Chitinimonas viridis]GLR11256.1 hypothetical protein GCM10007907_00460 [Chitinimonas prasina]